MDTAAAPARPRIVILGGGFAGAYCAQALERTLRGVDAEVVLIDRYNYFVFHPLLIEAGTGSLEPRHAVVSIRAFLKRTRFVMAEIVQVEAAWRRVDYRVVGEQRVQTLFADHLVIALGSITRLPPSAGTGGVPGVRGHAFEIKSLADAVSLRDRAIGLLELASNTADPEERREVLRWVVVGGNFTGVELAAEFHHFMRRAAKRYANLSPGDIGMTLVEKSDRILGPLGPGLSDYAYRNMKGRGMDIRLRETVSRVEPRSVTLAGGDVLRARTVVWCAGIEPSPLVAPMGVPLDDRGYIRCDRDLRVTGFESVWAIGDCAVNIGPDGRAYPATAQHGLREGVHCAANIGRLLRGRPTRPCDLINQGTLAALGCRTGVATLFGIKLSGFPAWFLWRTVYLLKMPGWARRVRMALDWTMDLFFPRDDVMLGVHRRADATGPAGTL